MTEQPTQPATPAAPVTKVIIAAPGYSITVEAPEPMHLVTAEALRVLRAVTADQTSERTGPIL